MLVYNGLNMMTQNLEKRYGVRLRKDSHSIDPFQETDSPPVLFQKMRQWLIEPQQKYYKIYEEWRNQMPFE